MDRALGPSGQAPQDLLADQRRDTGRSAARSTRRSRRTTASSRSSSASLTAMPVGSGRGSRAAAPRERSSAAASRSRAAASRRDAGVGRMRRAVRGWARRRCPRPARSTETTRYCPAPYSYDRSPDQSPGSAVWPPERPGRRSAPGHRRVRSDRLSDVRELHTVRQQVRTTGVPLDQRAQVGDRRDFSQASGYVPGQPDQLNLGRIVQELVQDRSTSCASSVVRSRRSLRTAGRENPHVNRLLCQPRPLGTEGEPLLPRGDELRRGHRNGLRRRGV